MKIAYSHLINRIHQKPSLEEVSNKLFQLGHEHEILDNKIFDLELTPNRGDCLSLKGILRELNVFYDVNLDFHKSEIDIAPFNFDFKNKAIDSCPNISFLKLEINPNISSYKGDLKNYFDELDIKKNNFFTDISNYISYELGQPTHCYDASKISQPVSLEYTNDSHDFLTLLDKNIEISEKNLIFSSDNEIINLAGIIGSKSTSCDKNTNSVIIECAYFNPESIINKAVKYDITSEAAHKFERGVDPECHIEVLRRFIKIVQDHAEINKIELYSDHSKQNEPDKIENRTDIIQNILGIKISDNDFVRYLNNLGFKFIQNFIEVPSYRSDIITHNDIAEEIARSIGYDNIPVHEFDIGPSKKIHSHKILNEEKIKDYLLDNGYHEVINNPFEDCESKNSITLDNPLDSSRRYLRTNLKNSLINNLLYNERRQKDSVKLFEISNVYSYKNEIKTKKILGIIASGRIGKNYRDFSKRIDKDNFQKFICDLVPKEVCTFDDIPRYDLNSKSKTYIAYVEIDLNKLHNLKTIN